jgi:hypothetical protein
MAPEEVSQETPAEVEETEVEAAPAEEAKAEEPAAAEETDWKAYARKHERLSKKASKQVEDLQAELAKAKEATQTDQEKALEQARKEAADEARNEVVGELRKERLQAAVARSAAGKFADVDDAIKLLDLEDDDIFDEDGKVNADNLKSALDDLLDRKPHLAASPLGKKPAGDADAGKGQGGSKSLEDMSVEEHLEAIRRTK